MDLVPASEGFTIQCVPWFWELALEPMETVMMVPVATYVRTVAGTVIVMVREAVLTRSPQDVAVFGQLVRGSGGATLKRNRVPVATFTSPQVMLARLKFDWNVKARVSEELPPVLSRLFWTVKTIVWLEVAEVAELFKKS